MKTAWNEASAIVDKIALDLSKKSREEVLALSNYSVVQLVNGPARLIISIQHTPMLNGTSSVSVEAGKFWFFGQRWRSITRNFEFSAEGQVQHFPLR